VFAEAVLVEEAVAVAEAVVEAADKEALSL
jgi:hypothetical protein